MTYYLSTIYDDVRSAIDEIALNDATFISSQDNGEMETIIRQKATQAADHVHLNADLSRFYGDEFVMLSCPATPASDYAYVDSSLVGHIILNSNSNNQGVPHRNLLRLVHAMVYTPQGTERWSYPVNAVIQDHENEYAELRDPYFGASTERPAVALHRSFSVPLLSYDELELHKFGTATDTAIVRIIEHAQIATDNNSQKTIAVDQNLYHAFILQLAALLLTTYNETDRANALFALATREMGIEPPSQP